MTLVVAAETPVTAAPVAVGGGGSVIVWDRSVRDGCVWVVKGLGLSIETSFWIVPGSPKMTATATLLATADGSYFTALWTNNPPKKKPDMTTLVLAHWLMACWTSCA